MGLSNAIINKFTKALFGDNKSVKSSSESNVYATVTEISDKKAKVLIDGASEPTEVGTLASASVGDRVMVKIKNHSAIILGNSSDVSASANELTATTATANKASGQASSAVTQSATALETAKTAKEIASATNAHFTYDSGGVHVYETANDYTKNANLILNQNGMLFRNNTTSLAQFDANNVSFYDGTSNNNVVASFGSGGVALGYGSGSLRSDASGFEIKANKNSSLQLKTEGAGEIQVKTDSTNFELRNTSLSVSASGPNWSTKRLIKTLEVEGGTTAIDFHYDEKSGKNVLVMWGDVILDNLMGVKSTVNRVPLADFINWWTNNDSTYAIALSNGVAPDAGEINVTVGFGNNTYIDRNRRFEIYMDIELEEGDTLYFYAVKEATGSVKASISTNGTVMCDHITNNSGTTLLTSAGNAISATKATQDGDGANIASTYLKSANLASMFTATTVSTTTITLSSGGADTKVTSVSTLSGYTCLGVVGWYTNNGSSGSGESNLTVYKVCLSDSSGNPQATMNNTAYARFTYKATGTVKNVTITAKLLWAKNS